MSDDTRALITTLTGRDIHREWRDGMREQGRHFTENRGMWETLSRDDQELDERIASHLNAIVGQKVRAKIEEQERLKESYRKSLMECQVERDQIKADNKRLRAELKGVSRLIRGEQIGVSTGVCGSTTYGYGELDEDGYWQYPVSAVLLRWAKEQEADSDRLKTELAEQREKAYKIAEEMADEFPRELAPRLFRGALRAALEPEEQK